MSAVDKTETSTFSWLDLAFGFQKYRRKTIGFGQFNKKERCWEDEVHVRELSFTQGGVGCALWDAAILLCHWIHDNGANVLEDKKVLELGSGTGAPGILSARFANLVYLTDYTEEILDNLQYNIWLNCQDLQNKGLYELESKVATSARVEYLDWDRYQQGTINETFDVVIGNNLPRQRNFRNKHLLNCRMPPGNGSRQNLTVKDIYLKVIEATTELAKQEFEKSALHFTASSGLKELRSLWESRLLAFQDELDFPEQFFLQPEEGPQLKREEDLGISTDVQQYELGKFSSSQLSLAYRTFGLEPHGRPVPEINQRWNRPVATGNSRFPIVQDESNSGRFRNELSQVFRQGFGGDNESITVGSDDPISYSPVTRSSSRGGKRSFMSTSSPSMSTEISRPSHVGEPSSNKRTRLKNSVETKERGVEEDTTKQSPDSEESLDSELSGSDTDLVDSVENEEEPDNYILAQHERIRKDNKRGKWKIPLRYGVAHILGHEYLFERCNGELLW
eukprot:jgi/Galph1/4957/GphlegSOOS_G3638.1